MCHLSWQETNSCSFPKFLICSGSVSAKASSPCLTANLGSLPFPSPDPLESLPPSLPPVTHRPCGPSWGPTHVRVPSGGQRGSGALARLPLWVRHLALLSFSPICRPTAAPSHTRPAQTLLRLPLPSISAVPAWGSFTWRVPTQKAQAVPQEPAPRPPSQATLSPLPQQRDALCSGSCQPPVTFPGNFPTPSKGTWASLVAQLVKNLPAVQETRGSIPGLGRSPGEQNGYPLQCSGLENCMDYIVRGVTKS